MTARHQPDVDTDRIQVRAQRTFTHPDVGARTIRLVHDLYADTWAGVIEDTGEATVVSFGEAVRLAIAWLAIGGTVNLGRPGGALFDTHIADATRQGPVR